MAEYAINKGIGRPAEFRGLKSQYLFIFSGGLLSVFILFVIMYMAGVGQWVCIGFGLVAGLGITGLTFNLNAKYGSHGLMKAGARRRHPRRIVSRKAVTRIMKS